LVAETEKNMSEPVIDELPPSTMPSHVSFYLKGFHDEDVGRRLAYAVADVIREVGAFIDLTKLDGVTIAKNYDEALTELDRGVDCLRPLTRSNTEEMQGIAMTPAVIREGVVKSHIVFNAAHVVPLISDETTTADRLHIYGLICHECAHVEITAAKEEAIPEARFGTDIKGYEHGVMYQIAELCWDEYAACRMSAKFDPNQNQSYAEIILASVAVARENSDAAIRSYRIHGDVNQLVSEAGQWLHRPIKASVYLLGGMDAVDAGWEQFPEVKEALEDKNYLQLVEKLWAELQDIWDSRENWGPSLGVFAGLEAIAKEVFDDGGIIFRTDHNGECRIDVPFTPQTMPFD
jgi:hypothetical protein